MAEAWGGEGEPSRILHDLEMVCELDKTCVFIHPVDLICVAFPTDLSTITENKLYMQVRREVGEEGRVPV